MARSSFSNKHHAIRTWSEICQRFFTSKSECARGEELWQEQLDGKITGLDFQVRFILSVEPKVSIKIDFAYCLDGVKIYEDSKGILTREYRAKLAWLKKEKGIDVILSKPRRLVDHDKIKARQQSKSDKQRELSDVDKFLEGVINDKEPA